MKQLNIGWSSMDITPDRPFFVAGQLYTRISSYIHDPLTATALVLENGEEQMTFVSLDMVSAPIYVVKRVWELLKDVEEIDEKRVDFHAIHTHNSCTFGPVGNETLIKYFGEDRVMPIEMPENILYGEEATEWISQRLYELILDAWANRSPGGVSYAQDYAAVGFNRRPVFKKEDGTEESKMYGDCSLDSFVRFEGPVDHTADVLYTWDMDRNLTGVAVDIPCPSQVMELHCFVSADYWTPTRARIREELGNIYVLPICGAGGDQNPLDLTRISKNNKKELILWNAQATEVFRNFDLAQECDMIGSRICDAVVRCYPKARDSIQKAPVFHSKAVELELPLRKVDKEEYEEAAAFLAGEKEKFSKDKPMTTHDQLRMFEPMGVAERWEEQQKMDTCSFRMYVVRIGRAAIITNPFELFVDYGVRVRARCKADQVFHIQLANGSLGYLPTPVAVAGGSYSSKPASTHVGPEGGDILAEKMIAEIDAMWE